MQAVWSMGLEGVIAKRKNSVYEPGERSRDWVKLKLDRHEKLFGRYEARSNRGSGPAAGSM